MRVWSANLLAPSGVLYSVRWIGTDEELQSWQALGFVPMSAEKVLGIDVLTEAALGKLAFALLPVSGRV
jgi:hypothetical protein